MLPPRYIVGAALLSVAAASPPLPNERQLEFMDLETTQFMHFGIDTHWRPPTEFLHNKNPTYHNCGKQWTGLSNDSQTEGYWPCLNPKIVTFDKLDTESWMEASAALGMKEVCLTAKHEGGYTMWPSQHTPYGVQSSMNFRGGKGDVLKDFAASARRWGIKICYYCNPMTDGYLAQIAKVDEEQYMAAQKGMLTELLAPDSPYGPVNRLWFDGVKSNSETNGDFRPGYLGTNYSGFYTDVYKHIRETSPSTLISSKRGDVCDNTASLYTNDGPAPNSTDSSDCTAATEAGRFFHPNELHGVTMQEGPDGNTPAVPTYWFWHPWACAGNVSGCPWVGHANASRVFDGYVATVGHGGVLNMNIAPQADGLMNASVVAVMHEAGRAINDTFHLNHAGRVGAVSGPCGTGVAVVDVTGPFDYIVTMEELKHGQRVGNYSIDFRREGSAAWEVLVPPVVKNSTGVGVGVGQGDRPDGHDPRDQYVGHKRIDTPVVKTGGLRIAQVRFNCLQLVASVDASDSDVHLRQLSLHKKIVPWKN